MELLSGLFQVYLMFAFLSLIALKIRCAIDPATDSKLTSNDWKLILTPIVNMFIVFMLIIGLIFGLGGAIYDFINRNLR